MTTVLSGPPSPVAAKIPPNNNESENASIAQEKPQERAVDVEETKEDKENKETKQDEVYDIPIGEYCEELRFVNLSKARISLFIFFVIVSNQSSDLILQ